MKRYCRFQPMYGIFPLWVVSFPQKKIIEPNEEYVMTSEEKYHDTKLIFLVMARIVLVC